MDAPVMQVKPSVKRAMTTKIVIVVAFIALIIGMGFYLNSIVGVGVFLDVFSELGIEINGTAILTTLAGLAGVIIAVVLIMSYVNYHEVAYTLYPDKILYTPPAASLMNREPVEYLYANITGITFKKQGALKPDLIQIALTGQKQSTLSIPYIDNPTETMASMQKLIDEWKARYYAEYGHEYRMQNIMG